MSATIADQKSRMMARARIAGRVIKPVHECSEIIRDLLETLPDSPERQSALRHLDISVSDAFLAAHAHAAALDGGPQYLTEWPYVPGDAPSTTLSGASQGDTPAGLRARQHGGR